MEYKGLAASLLGILRKPSESEPKNSLRNAKEFGIVSDFNSETYVCINGHVGAVSYIADLPFLRIANCRFGLKT